MAKKIKLGTVLPPDTFFYTIPFEQPGLKLTSEIPVPKGRRARMGIHTEHKAFKNNVVSVEVKAPDNSENILFLHVGLTELDIACTCGMPDGKLCYHAYVGLYSISFDFATCKWCGLFVFFGSTTLDSFLLTASGCLIGVMPCFAYSSDSAGTYLILATFLMPSYNSTV